MHAGAADEKSEQSSIDRMLVTSSLVAAVSAGRGLAMASRRAAFPASMSLRASSSVSTAHERRLLRGVLSEALEQQGRKREALEAQAAAAEQQLEGGAGECSQLEAAEAKAVAKARAKAARCAEALPHRLAECDAAEPRDGEAARERADARPRQPLVQ